MEKSKLTWVDFTRRNDPAHPAGVEILEKKLLQGFPHVFCFWTKAPVKVASLYAHHIKKMQEQGTLVLSQVTLNNYKEMEPGVNDFDKNLGPLIELLGGPQYIRLRFDPIIVGYTTPAHFSKTVEVALKHGIKRIIVNFLVPEYKGVGLLLAKKGFKIQKPSHEMKVEILSRLLSMSRGIEIAVCAESFALTNDLPQLKKAACSDAEWAEELRPDLKGIFTLRPSREGCGCCYSADWGIYRNWGGYACPHQCLYCYAK